ncbi:MAG: MBL fold metallo-hydrolase [Galactobacter sp.]
MSQQSTSVVTLGTAGGPVWWRSGRRKRAGISTAVVVGDRHYVVDLGYGAGRQMTEAVLEMDQLGGVFITHLHSDHVVDVPSLVLFGLGHRDPERGPLPVYGPPDRGVLTPVSPRATTTPRVVHPSAPTPGTRAMFQAVQAAFATDLNDRVLDNLWSHPDDLLDVRDLVIPESAAFHANDNPTPDMEPFVVFEDDRVKVSAILVAHPPMAPAFGYRFDTEGGSVAISGDTREHDNTARLAAGVDLLLHEAIDHRWVDELVADMPEDVAQASHDHHYGAHTPVQGAVRVAQAAGAKRLALHHLVPGDARDAAWEIGSELMGDRFLVPDDLERIALR